MRFIAITLIVDAPDPRTGEQIPDPPWGWGSGPLTSDAVPARAVASAV